MAEKPRFELVQDEEPAKQAADHQAATKMLLLALGALSQRTLHAIADGFVLLAVGSIFWLAMTISDPTPMQLARLGIYGIFVLTACLIVRKK